MPNSFVRLAIPVWQFWPSKPRPDGISTGRSVSKLVQTPLADKYASRKKVDSPGKKSPMFQSCKTFSHKCMLQPLPNSKLGYCVNQILLLFVFSRLLCIHFTLRLSLFQSPYSKKIVFPKLFPFFFN